VVLAEVGPPEVDPVVLVEVDPVDLVEVDPVVLVEVDPVVLAEVDMVVLVEVDYSPEYLDVAPLNRYRSLMVIRSVVWRPPE